MPEFIISDTSCLITLENIGELGLLQKLYGSITTTTEVANEFGSSLPEWVNIRAANNSQYQRLLELQVDRGEASAIALALEIDDCVLILDDIKARKVAANLSLSITGTVGVIVKAKLNGIIPSIMPFLQLIRLTNFRLSESVIAEALIQAGE